MKEAKLLSEKASSEIGSPSRGEDVQQAWQGVVKRRSFLKGIGIAGATLSAGALLGTAGAAETTRSTGRLSKGDVALLQFAAWAEIVESDLWTQYAELGGVGPSGGGSAQSNEEFQGFIGGNPAYTLTWTSVGIPATVAERTRI